MNITPEQLVRKLQKTVIGQDKYIKDICTAVWMHNLRYEHFQRTGEFISHPKNHILCLGQSGTGKTLAVQTLAKLLDLPLLIETTPELRGSGWRGTSVSSIIIRVLEAAGNDENKARHTIVVLDEFDKTFTCQVADSSFYPINSLLTFMGGSVITHTESNQTTSLDTSNMLFICLGAFDGLQNIIQNRLSGKSGIGFGSEGYKEPPDKDIFKFATKEDLHAYGVPWELLGRISMISTTNDPSIDDFKRILTDSQASPIHQYDDLLFKSIGVHVGISDAAANHIAQTAKDSLMGARELSQIVSEILTPAVYTVGNDSSITGITLDLDSNGLFVSSQKGKRSASVSMDQHSRQDNEMRLLSDSDINTLKSVPFSCAHDKDSIIKCCLDIQDASENVKWRPISKIHPKEDIAAASCLLAISICTQLSDTNNQSPTMYDLFEKADKISPSEIAHDTSNQPLNLMRKEFMSKVLEHSVNLTKAAKIAKHLIREYALQYVYETKYSKH